MIYLKDDTKKHTTIDIDKIIRSRKSKLVKNLPQFIVNFIIKVAHQNQINDFIFENKDKFGLDFIAAAKKGLGFENTVYGIDSIPDSGRFIFVCNHPLGGIDFFSAILAVCGKYPTIKVIANDILLNLENLKDLFLPVPVFSKATLEAKERINQVLKSQDLHLMTFPAAEVSRKRKGIITDKEWNKSFVRFAIENERDIVPIYIDAVNSKKFYFVQRLREFFGIKLNLELFLLPSELFKKQNINIPVYIGKPISHKIFDDSKTHTEWAQIVKNNSYDLKNIYKNQL